MSTICFNLKRIDSDYIAIRHVKFGTSEYNFHRPLSFTNRTNKIKKNWWLEDKKYRYIWIVIGYKREGFETISFVTNDKVLANQCYKYMLESKKDYLTDKMFPSDYISARIVKIPFDKIQISKSGNKYYTENDLGKESFVLYAPEKICMTNYELRNIS